MTSDSRDEAARSAGVARDYLDRLVDLGLVALKGVAGTVHLLRAHLA